MSVPIVAALVAIVMIGIVIGADLFRDFVSTRERLTLDQRKREDVARQQAISAAEFDKTVGIFGSIFDPLGLFHN